MVAELTGTRLPELLAEIASDTIKSAVTAGNVMAAGSGGGVTRQRTDNYPVTAWLRSQLTQLAELHGTEGNGVLLSLDEVHRAATEDIRVIAHTIQHMFREGRPVAFLAAGLPAAIEDVLNDAVLTFLRRAERLTLGAVSDPDVQRAIRTPIEQAGRFITDGALAMAAASTQGYPFLVQLVGYQMWIVASDEALIDEQQARAGIVRAVRRVGRLVHEPALSGLSDVDRAFLTAMTVDTGASRLAEIAERLGVYSTYAGQYRIRLMASELTGCLDERERPPVEDSPPPKDQDASDDQVDVELFAYCSRPLCRKEFRQVLGRGRRRDFCSETCRRQADADYKRAKAMVEHFDRLARLHRYDVLAFGRSTDSPEVDEQVVMERARAAVGRADAVVRFAGDADPLLFEELTRLADAVRPLLQGEARPRP